MEISNVGVGAETQSSITSVVVSDFHGFSEFALDTSFSSVSSHSSSNIEGLVFGLSPPSSPNSRKDSLNSSSSVPHSRSPPRMSPTRMPSAAVSSLIHGSLPLARHIGRGTPIDRQRRLQWSGSPSDEAGEDGLLFSPVRSTSLDSSSHPFPRSISPELKSFSSRSLLHRRPSTLPPLVRSRTYKLSKSPEIKIEGLGSDDAKEWESIMQTVLDTADSAAAAGPSNTNTVDESPSSTLPETEVAPDTESKLPNESPKTEQRSSLDFSNDLQQLNNVVERDLRINAALDLAFRPDEGMSFAGIGLLPRRDRSSSIYSSNTLSAGNTPPPAMMNFDNRSSSQPSVEDGQQDVGTQMEVSPWWKRIFRTVNKLRWRLGRH